MRKGLEQIKIDPHLLYQDSKEILFETLTYDHIRRDERWEKLLDDGFVFYKQISNGRLMEAREYFPGMGFDLEMAQAYDLKNPATHHLLEGSTAIFIKPLPAVRKNEAILKAYNELKEIQNTNLNKQDPPGAN